MIIIKIAFRNILLNRKRSILIGLAIFISSFFFIISNAIMNGTETQMLKSCINLQTGHVTVMGKNIKEISGLDPSRFLFLNDSNNNIIDKDEYNRATQVLNKFIEDNGEEIEGFYTSIRKCVEVNTGDNMDKLVIYGLSQENKDFIINSKTIEIDKGEFLVDEPYGVYISKEKSGKNNLSVGDKVTVNVSTAENKNKSMIFTVRGIYKDGAGYDSSNMYMSNKDARELLDYDEEYFDIGRIYLKNPNKASEFANRLDKALINGSNMLRAEEYQVASEFFTSLPNMLKMVFSIFVFFLLIIISLGLRSTVKMYLFERMKEFGTLRAIGYSRFQCYSIIFCEIFLLAVISFGLSFIASIIPIEIFRHMGLYVGTGEAISYLFAGDTIYPFVKFGDIFIALLVMIIFSIMATLNPGLKLCYQKISDIMIKGQKRVYITKELFKSTFTIIGFKFFKN